MTRKQIYKKIKWMAKDLPEEEYEVWNGVGKDAVMTKHKANHSRRLISIWNETHSLSDLNDYFLKYNLELKHSSNGPVKSDS